MLVQPRPHAVLLGYARVERVIELCWEQDLCHLQGSLMMDNNNHWVFYVS